EPMTPATTITSLEQWQILFHETMAALLRAQEAVKRQFGFWGLLNGLWKSSRDLKALVASMKAISELRDGLLTEETIRGQISQIQKLLTSIEELIDTAKRAGLMNRSLTSPPLGAIRIRGEALADQLESLEMSLDSEVLQAITEGRGQIESGDFETME